MCFCLIYRIGMKANLPNRCLAPPIPSDSDSERTVKLGLAPPDSTRHCLSYSNCSRSNLNLLSTSLSLFASFLIFSQLLVHISQVVKRFPWGAGITHSMSVSINECFKLPVATLIEMHRKTISTHLGIMDSNQQWADDGSQQDYHCGLPYRIKLVK